MKKSIEINNQQRIPFYNLRKSISFENCIQCEQNKYSCLCIEFNTNNRIYTL